MYKGLHRRLYGKQLNEFVEQSIRSVVTADDRYKIFGRRGYPWELIKLLTSFIIRNRFPILKSEAEVLQASESREKLRSNGCDVYIGSASLSKDVDGKVCVRVCRPAGCVDIPATNIVIATGSRSNRPAEIRPGVPLPFTKGRVVCSTEMGSLPTVPKAAAIIGGGVIAVEYATVLAELGTGVSLLCAEKDFLPFLEPELREALKSYMSQGRILRVEDPLESIGVGTEEDPRVEVSLEARVPGRSGRRLKRRLLVDLVLYSGGRDANSDGIGCEEVGVQRGRFGRVVVDKSMRTSVPNVYAIGDVTGPPALASAAQFRGRQVALQLFGRESKQETESESTEMEVDVAEEEFFLPLPDVEQSALTSDTPLTLWTIPEVASVGVSADQARAALGGDPTQRIIEGYGYYRDTARGRLSGDLNGFLKVVARIDGPNKHTVLGVHIIGDSANELIQLGSVLVSVGSSAEQVSNTPFAAVTLGGLYQVACDDVLVRSPLNARKKKSDLVS